MNAVKVSLREKKITGGRKSLYLDFYPAIKHPETGKDTRREFLGLYIMDRPKTEIDKATNKETKALGESIRAKRQLAIQANNFGFFEQKNMKPVFLNIFLIVVKNSMVATKAIGKVHTNTYMNLLMGNVKCLM